MLRALRRFRNESAQNDESTPLLIDAEAQNRRTNRLSFRANLLSEFELNFNLINETFPNLQSLFNYESLKVINCPKFESALESIPLFVRGFFMRFDSALCLHFIIDDFIGELTEFEFFNFFNSFKEFLRSFMIIFEDQQDNSSLIYWRLKDSMQIFSLHANGNSIGFSKFLKDFLINCLKNGHNGIHPLMQNYPKNQIRVKTLSSLLADDKCMNLLHLAARDGKLELIKFLLNVCDMNLKAGGKMAIDLAYENQNFDVVCLLLKEGSRFPRNFDASLSMPDEIKIFVEMSQKLHQAIGLKKLEKIEAIVEENPSLRFFYDTQNRSALNIALTSGAFDIYKFLMAKNCTFGPHEIFKDLLEELSEDQREELTEINSSMLQCVGDKHILMLMSNTQVGPDDKQARLSLVCDALQKLNTIPGIKILLQIVAATRNFQLIFDFNREHILFLQPAEEGYVTGLFDICGRIYIGAQHLLNPLRAHEVLGVIAHELCHYVMWIVFKNTAKPYEVNDEVKRARFDQILAHCKQNSNLEGIIALVFSQYGEEMHVAELIVRVPHALGLYIDDDEKLEKFRVNYKDLNEYYEETVRQMREKLPKIEEEAEKRIRKETLSPLNFVKFHWRKILVGIFLLAVAAFSVTLIARSCLFKPCGDSRAFCIFEHFTAVCKCPQNSNETLYWESNKCNQCLMDEHCARNQSCHLNDCFNSRNIFTCDDKSKRMFSSERCDGKFDCDDKSDETYNCIYGRLHGDGRNYYTLEDDIDHDDFLIYINEPTINCTWFDVRIPLLQYLPVNISKTFPNLKVFKVIDRRLTKISNEHFWGLFHVWNLDLRENKIQFIDANSFEDLKAIKYLVLEKNDLTRLNEKTFINLLNLRELNLAHNSLLDLPKKIFDNLKNLVTLKLCHNLLSDLSANIFDKLESLQFLYLEHNRIEYFHPKMFVKLISITVLKIGSNSVANMTNPLFGSFNGVSEIILSSSMLERISEHTLEGCYFLQKLDLSNSVLVELPKNAFKSLRQMKNLDLKYNRIEKLDEDIFKFNPQLQIVDFSHNRLKDFPNDFLNNLSDLRYFYAKSNQISTLKSSLFKNCQKLFAIDFGDNQIRQIDEDFIDNLKDLIEIDLSMNFCIDKDYIETPSLSQVERERFKEDVRTKCKNITG